MRDLSAECDRDSSLLYQVAAGKRPGTNLLPTLIDLARTGHAARRPERRTTRSGAAGPDPRPARPAGARAAATHTDRPDARQVQCADQLPGRRCPDEADHRPEVAARRWVGSTPSRRPWTRWPKPPASSGGSRSSCTTPTAPPTPWAPSGATAPTTPTSGPQGEWQDAFEWLGQEASAVANRLYDLQALNIPIVGVDVTAFGVPDPTQPVPPQRPTPQACQEGRREEGSREGPATELNLGQNGRQEIRAPKRRR